MMEGKIKDFLGRDRVGFEAEKFTGNPLLKINRIKNNDMLRADLFAEQVVDEILKDTGHRIDGFNPIGQSAPTIQFVNHCRAKTVIAHEGVTAAKNYR